LTSWFHIALWVGAGGGGKTTGMYRDLSRELDYGTQYDHAYTNTNFRHEKAEKISYAELKDLRGELVNGRPRSLLCLDQLHKYVDNRETMSKRNISMSKIIIESRQHGFDLHGTTWGRGSIDPRLRKYVELEILCERKDRQGGFQYTMLDGNDDRLKTMPIMRYEKCKKYWDLFDMNELVENIEPSWDAFHPEKWSKEIIETA
jgi:hypothetical protein